MTAKRRHPSAQVFSKEFGYNQCKSWYQPCDRSQMLDVYISVVTITKRTYKYAFRENNIPACIMGPPGGRVRGSAHRDRG